MSFEVTIPTPDGPNVITISPGSSIIFVGANGGGKTRLAVHIENILGLEAHRISSHRALVLNPSVAKIKENDALNKLRAGADEKGAYPRVRELKTSNFRSDHRWRREPVVGLLDDFSSLLQVLFANQSNEALKTHQKVRNGNYDSPPLTKFEELATIWQQLLPDRQLDISGDDIRVLVTDSGTAYSASDLSDGERALFYLIGQTLVAAENSLLIIDEPELHIHKSIMSKLWDRLEAIRKDCAFVFITHDLEFAAGRVAEKFVIQDYKPLPEWNIQEVPDDAEFDEEITTVILGSRRPILFVEGRNTSLDAAIYRCCYPEWTIVPMGSCEAVIHAVVTMRENTHFHRLSCSGIVDADDRQQCEKTRLNELGIAVLPVSEIENIILLPTVSRAIARMEGYEGHELESVLSCLQSAVFDSVDEAAIKAASIRYCRRRIDRALKRIDLTEAEDVESLSRAYCQQTQKVNVRDIADAVGTRIRAAVEEKDLTALLRDYDNKGLLALAAKHLKGTPKKSFENWLVRILENSEKPEFTEALQSSLPTIGNSGA